MKLKSILSGMVATAVMTLGVSHAFADGLDELPADLQKAYQGMDDAQLRGPSMLRDFKAKKHAPCLLPGWRTGDMGRAYSPQYSLSSSWSSSSGLVFRGLLSTNKSG